MSTVQRRLMKIYFLLIGDVLVIWQRLERERYRERDRPEQTEVIRHVIQLKQNRQIQAMTACQKGTIPSHEQ